MFFLWFNTSSHFQCPFHGPIIPRDENGDPVANSDFQVTQSQTGSGIVQLDQHLQEAIRDAKGAELLQQCKKGKGDHVYLHCLCAGV